MSNIEQYRVFTKILHDEEQRSQALNDIINLLNFTSPAEAALVIQNVGICKILQCLNATDKTHVELSCEVLKKCFEIIEPADVIRQYITYLMYLLRHEKVSVRQVAVEVVYKILMTNSSAISVPQHIDIFVAVAQMVCDRDVAIANKAVLITSNLPEDAYPKVLEEMRIAFNCNTSSKCNAFEIVVNISSKSPDLFKLCMDQGYINFMVSELQSDDILYQMNILELLSQLARTPYGMNYLIENGSFKQMVQQLQDLRNNPLGGLLMTGYIKFFGTVTYQYSKEIINEYPVLVETLLEGFDSNDQTIIPVVLDTFGIIGSTIEGKLCLAAFGSKFTQAVEKVGEMIRNSPTDIKVRALICFSHLISVEQDSQSKTKPIDHRVTLMTREWFRSLSKQPASIETLFGVCQNPFPDIRFSAFTLLDAVCQHKWGEDLVANCAGFIEFLLDRTLDYKKQLMELKYDIIKRLSKSTAFEANTLMRLQTYVDQGPFYSETIMQVAMEEGD
ncbi:26S proteasome non-ATPase regulatory subunit 5 [Zerene cesonia]|uniref:26S proteasome non-ATPase regulatory subunit 5 n=1 Tax=Zerene cesonia TaxID=33412 RepID=UPI0018E5837C|nr:26S proteasome non-ATPase regulatory subunit 5 [Zerene cesonia]